MKSFVRDLNLNLLTSNHKIEVDISKRYNNRVRLFMPNRKLIDYVIKSGGVLTGSRALRCFKVNDKYVLERNTKDWDFIITQKMAFDICDKFDINTIPNIDDVISIQSERYWKHPDYADSYRVGPVDVQLIIKSELPEYTISNGIRISPIHYIINEKMKLIDHLRSLADKPAPPKSKNREELSKHLQDMTQVIIKFNSAS
jgi:hypothetical protein